MEKELSPWQRAKAALQALEVEAGGRAALGRVFGVSRQAASRWRVLPEDYLLQAAEAFGKRPADLRPDIPLFRLRTLLQAQRAAGAIPELR